MYEILHQEAPHDELEFYLSYAKKGMKILEPLCGSGRFLIPFMERGWDISGIDLSEEMLKKLKQKAPHAKILQGDILEYISPVLFDYIFISSGSISLFTDIRLCKIILSRLKDLLAQKGKLFFAVDTVAQRCPDDIDYKTSISVNTEEGYSLFLKNKNHYDEKTHTQFSPGFYELYKGNELVQREFMDFQTHLYTLGEMEDILKQSGFNRISVYSSFSKAPAVNNSSEMFLYECSC